MASRILKPLSAPGKRRPFGVYDFEWWAANSGDAEYDAYRESRGKKPYDFRIGAYLDERGSRLFTTVNDFLQTILTPAYEGRLLFGHWSGTSDILFLLYPLLERKDLRTSIMMNGSSAAIVRVEQGKRKWTFVDSSFLFRMSLAEIGKKIGTKKGGDGDGGLGWKERDDEALARYNLRDCEVLYKAIDDFQTLANGMGARMGLTMSATSVDLLRRRYLKDAIATPEHLNDFASAAYFASRVEVYKPHLPMGHYYDVNSSFPYAMTFPLPGGPIRESMGALPKRGLYIAECEVTVPESYLPPLPYRLGQRLFFPFGTWRGTFTSVDLDLAREMGCEVQKVGKVVEYEERHDFADFANDVYSRRMASDGFMKLAFKLLGNGCYGKMNESEEKVELLINPPHTFCPDHFRETPNALPGLGIVCVEHGDHDCKKCLWGCDCLSLYAPNVWQKKVKRELPHRHVAVAAFIVAIARRTLYRGQLENAHNLHYSDTDSLFLSDTMTHRVGKALGDFKHEGKVSDMLFVCPKVYGGKDENGDPILHAKGFSLGKKHYDPSKGRSVYPPEVVARYEQIIAKDPVYGSHMVRPREYLRTLGDLRDVPIGSAGKRLQLLDRPKRAFTTTHMDGPVAYPWERSNDTRPWHVSELLIPYETGGKPIPEDYDVSEEEPRE
jgi:hypothetical protein